MSTNAIANQIREQTSALRQVNMKMLHQHNNPSKQQFIMAAMQGLLAGGVVSLNADVIAHQAEVIGTKTWLRAQKEGDA